MIELKDKNVLVVGLGKSGLSAARFLKNRGAYPIITDQAPENKLAGIVRDVNQIGIPTQLGGHKVETFLSSDLIILSPGVPHTIEPVHIANKKGIPVWGEIELASKFISEPIIAVTGTNGKTTTTTLIGEMLKSSGFNVFVGGNIGNPLIEYADSGQEADIVVAEVSSFQLDTTDTFKPKVSVLLNIAEDHLDRYDDFDVYALSKAKIFQNQFESDFAVLNSNDHLVMSITKHIRANKLFFNADKDIEAGAVINCDTVYLKINKDKKLKIDLSYCNLKGRHNYENIAAASLATLSVGGNIDGIMAAVKNFAGLPHRLEYVATIDDVQYFDDSKATNIGAVIRALETFKNPLILIMGGRDKGGDYSLLNELIKKHARLLVLTGEAADKIENVLGDIVQTIRTDSLDEAVLTASKAANPGDAVLLSPACSSFDMFENYHMRGEAFCHAVKKLKQGDQKL
ncbi:MAG: UDP-N-acetylmuramoyl-L-alanine--D-glutamate ligase [Deltaproteobacteria bacterium]|nr:UDP-N-acetylmuramoyl-L-alanine--D-glutamate ligase [Deltaproteobacteria bacterium]